MAKQLSSAARSGAPCQTRVIVLGASNVERGISTLVSVARAAFPGPIEFFLACGHGRSYGLDSSVLGRRLTGISQCAMWSALSERPALPAVAVLTDVGNDLLYGAPHARIADWVEECITQLRAHQAHVALAGLPLGALATLPRWRFALLSRVLFPMHSVNFEAVRADAAALDAALRAIAERHQTGWIAPPAGWYGFDPIHIRRSVSHVAWEKIFSASRAALHTVDEAPRASFQQWLYLKRLRPLRRHWWGVEQYQSQPAGALADGSLVWLY